MKNFRRAAAFGTVLLAAAFSFAQAQQPDSEANSQGDTAGYCTPSFEHRRYFMEIDDPMGYETDRLMDAVETMLEDDSD